LKGEEAHAIATGSPAWTGPGQFSRRLLNSIAQIEPPHITKIGHGKPTAQLLLHNSLANLPVFRFSFPSSSRTGSVQEYESSLRHTFVLSHLTLRRLNNEF